MRKSIFAAFFACILFIPLAASAAQIRAFVGDFSISAPGSSPPPVGTLFTSRIAGDDLVIVGSAAEADVVFTGSYTKLGKSYSLDALAKLPSGRVLATAFEQFQDEEGLIPALNKICPKLHAAVADSFRNLTAAPASPQTSPPPAAGAAPALPVPAAAAAGRSWKNQRLPGELCAVAPGRPVEGGREYFTASDRGIRLYRQAKELTLLGEDEVGITEKVIALDTRLADGALFAYLTVMDSDAPVSRIYRADQNGLKLVAKNLPYLFRSIALFGATPRIYAQQMGREEDFYGDVFELIDTPSGYQLKNPVKLPAGANIFNFNMVRDPSGNPVTIVIKESGSMVVYSQKGEELWTSPDRQGGSETYFSRETGNNVRVSGSLTRNRFLEQRITVAPDGRVLVPQNSGFIMMGNVRSYTSYSVGSFVWTGVIMEERWRSKPSRSYLADYYFDPAKNELVLLEVVQGKGIFTGGASTVQVIPAQ
ncbi:hypothetical protein L4X63_00970 [Geomonas sp. Red32]|uniref:hypothetical protein n=1 Tax=Geomonas sp. Red32 TaxID=2912856 RepID=UPI00202CE1ED|nr:hypothetical protein [Geomonas sp. Red32]MCM0080156.1 hypothetical protein [Geomonas sp. Red32]